MLPPTIPSNTTELYILRIVCIIGVIYLSGIFLNKLNITWFDKHYNHTINALAPTVDITPTTNSIKPINDVASTIQYTTDITYTPPPVEIYCIGACVYFYGFFQHTYQSLYGKDFSISNYYTVPNDMNQKQIVIMNTLDNPASIDKRNGNTAVVACNAEPHDHSAKVGFDMIIDDKQQIQLRMPDALFMYVPAYILLFWEKRQSSMYDLIKPVDYDAKAILAKKTKFCAYIARNCYSHRTKMFELLSTYKQVDGLGECNHNVPDIQPDRGLYNGDITYMDTAVQKYKEYKFVLAFENGVQPGYISEKIVNPMIANSIPIYLGDPNIHQHFNNKSFIDAQYFENYNAVVQFVKYLDQNDDAYLQYLQEPWLPNNEFTPWFPVIEKPDNQIFQQFDALPGRFWPEIA